MARPLRIDYLVRAFCTLETGFFRIILLFNSRPTGRSWGKFYEIQAPIPALRHNSLGRLSGGAWPGGLADRIMTIRYPYPR